MAAGGGGVIGAPDVNYTLFFHPVPFFALPLKDYLEEEAYWNSPEGRAQVRAWEQLGRERLAHQAEKR